VVWWRSQLSQLEKPQSCPTDGTSEPASGILLAQDAFDEFEPERFVSFEFQPDKVPPCSNPCPTFTPPKKGKRVTLVFGHQLLNPL
jgi:hypothetical protein